MNGQFTLIDGVIGVVLAIAMLRGTMIGLIRESFSIAALGAAIVAARYGAEPVGAWLVEVTDGETGPFPPTWMAGTVLAIGAAFGVAGTGFLIRRGAKWAGLNWADRIGGGVLGAAEGTVVAMLIVIGTTFVMGRQHPVVSGSRSVAAYDAVRAYVDETGRELPSVAAPGRD